MRDRDQAAPLHLAALSGSRAVLHLLILNGAGLEDRDSLHMTPLHYSTLKDNAEAAKLLLHYGADVDAAERLGKTPLHLATERGHCKVAFLSHGVRTFTRACVETLRIDTDCLRLYLRPRFVSTGAERFAGEGSRSLR